MLGVCISDETVRQFSIIYFALVCSSVLPQHTTYLELASIRNASNWDSNTSSDSSSACHESGRKRSTIYPRDCLLGWINLLCGCIRSASLGCSRCAYPESFSASQITNQRVLVRLRRRLAVLLCDMGRILSWCNYYIAAFPSSSADCPVNGRRLWSRLIHVRTFWYRIQYSWVCRASRSYNALNFKAGKI